MDTVIQFATYPYHGNIKTEFIKSGPPTASVSTSVPDIPPALDTPCTPCTGPAYSTPGQVSVLTVIPSGSPKTPDDMV
ncbi:hypothetical protein J6590_081525 [Homalodisca vitripennis]|nr:hypothetical protein J6590_081525 [Homalodisca vitripennis]